MQPRTALLVGATGLVGGHCLNRLLGTPAYGTVRVLARRATGRRHDRLDERVIDLDRLAAQAADVRGDDVFCCLGTTLAAAGSREAFRRVDHDYVVTVARLAHAAGARRFLLVSSVGADPDARAFYLRVKGEAERAVAALGYQTVELFRPSLLLGERRERRRAEAAGTAVARVGSALLLGPLRAYRPVRAEDVAAALVAAALRDEPGVHVRTYDAIMALASTAPP